MTLWHISFLVLNFMSVVSSVPSIATVIQPGLGPPLPRRLVFFTRFNLLARCRLTRHESKKKLPSDAIRTPTRSSHRSSEGLCYLLDQCNGLLEMLHGADVRSAVSGIAVNLSVPSVVYLRFQVILPSREYTSCWDTRTRNARWVVERINANTVTGSADRKKASQTLASRFSG